MGKYRLLVISSDTEMSKMLQIYFTKLEYEVDRILTPEDVPNNINLSHPHLILFDANVAASELKPLKSELVFSNIPIMWIITYDDRPDRIDGFTLEVDDIITKPFDIEELKIRVRNAIRANERSSQKRDI